MNQIGEMIGRLRREKNLTQKALAKLTHVNHVQISSYETGKVKPSKKVIAKICPTLGVKEDFFDRFLNEFVNPPTPEKLQEDWDYFYRHQPSEVDMACVSKLLRSIGQVAEARSSTVPDPELDQLMQNILALPNEEQKDIKKTIGRLVMSANHDLMVKGNS